MRKITIYIFTTIAAFGILGAGAAYAKCPNEDPGSYRNPMFRERGNGAFSPFESGSFRGMPQSGCFDSMYQNQMGCQMRGNDYFGSRLSPYLNFQIPSRDLTGNCGR
jgi:hypothetical protein